MALLGVKWTEASKCQSNPSSSGEWSGTLVLKKYISLSKADPLVVLVLVMFDVFSLFVKLKKQMQ